MTPIDLRQAAKTLYQLPPADFTAARNRAVKSADQREDAAFLKRLPRASAAAWVVTALAREEPSSFEQLLDLGQRLRDAQEDLDHTNLRSLGAERHRLVARASERARLLAEGAGVALSSAAQIEVSQTLQAAMTDPDAAGAITGGLLIRPLVVTGFGPVDLAGAVAMPAEGAPDALGAAGTAAGRASDAKARARKRAEDEAFGAVDEVAEAHGRVAELDATLAELAQRRTELEQERAEIEEQLRGVEGDLAEVYRDTQLNNKEKRQAERDEARANRRARQAQQKLDQLG
ncbi:hypothetical protein [Agreia sp. COWG]|uniref:hypothetical protein n=1 Tax=Agreia sp. COWG TaxID=2773266 RepID=UPI0019256CDF|nr:hypothetical protein [Agreia sp. COWG]CAD5991088.1 conserved protein of unknown function [Agreia sp. COWG]